MDSRRVTSTDYGNPYRPRLVRAINRVGAWFGGMGMAPSLEMASLKRAALKKERRDAFRDRSFETPLGVLLRSVAEEAHLNFFGRFVTRQRLVNLLRNRLRVEALLETHPHIREIPLPPVILITGLQRTGTTMLHRLLAADPDNRALLSYEALNPAPFCDDLERDRKKKIKVARQAERALSYLAPDFFAIHPVEALSPEEDVLLLDYALISTVAESTLRVPAYARFVESVDNRPAYDYLRLLLQVLSWRHGERTWILKSPHHMEFMEPFLSVFPEATVVMTHRDPTATLPSFCSMMCHGRGIFTDVVDPLEVGAHWLTKTARMLRIGHAVRDRSRAGRFVDVQYDDLLVDPMAQVERIYTVAGRQLGDNARARMDATRNANVQHLHGIHKYDMASFGFTAEQIHAAYGDYVPRFVSGGSGGTK